MPDNKFERPYGDRQIILDDFKKRVIDLIENHQPLPDTGIYDEPVRYFKANLKWTPIIFGLLTWAEDLAYWPAAANDLYTGIQQILIFEEGIELPDPPEIDCGDVEDCLSSSEIIANLNEQIDALNNQIIELGDQIDNLEKTVESGGNPLPDNPDMVDSGNDVCRGAYYISQRLLDKLFEYYDMAKTLTFQEFVEAMMSLASIGFIPAVSFWQYVFTISSPDLDDQAAEYVENIQIAFFCANWDLQTAKDLINADPEILSNQKALWLSVLDLFSQGQIDEWGLIGALDTTERDCSTGCPWVVVFDFAGLYVPDGTEDAIIPGNSWSVSGGVYNETVGYVALADQMTISHVLPQQCRIFDYYLLHARGPVALAVDASFWWRGSAGTGSEQYSTALRELSTTYSIDHFTVLGQPIMTQVKILHDAFFDPGPTYSQKIGWVKLIGSGVQPV